VSSAAPIASKVLRRRLRGGPELAVHGARLLVILAFFAGWQLAVAIGIVSSFNISTPGDVARSLWDQLGTSVLWDNALATAKATLLGFSIGSMLGILLGLILGSSRFLDRVMSPFLAMGNSMPRIALAPLFIVWFGLTIWAKVWLAVSVVTFILLYNTKAAAQTVDVDHSVIARMLDMGWWERFYKIVLPTCVPAIMAGLRLSVIFSLLGVIASEMIASRDGLGQLAIEASSSFRVDRLFAILIVIAGMAAVMNAGLDLLERKAIRWKAD
jgi:NitT/TauT family transport system permease protein